MTKRSKLWIVIKEVYRKNVQSMSFLWMVLGPLVMIAIFGLIGYFVANEQMSNSVGNIAIVSQSDELNTIFSSIEDANVYTFVSSEDEAQTQLKDERIDGYLVVEQSDSRIESTLYSLKNGKELNTSTMTMALNNYLRNSTAESFGLSSSQLQALQQANVTINEERLLKTESNELKLNENDSILTSIKTGLAYVVSIVMMLFVTNYISIISAEIATEKGSRIMEIVLSSISATTQFAGKMIGVGFIILTQLVVYLVMGIGIYFIVKFSPWMSYLNFGNLNVMSFIATAFSQGKMMLIWSIIFMVLGILMYSALAGFFGSLVSRTEDAQKMVAPIILLAVGGFYIGMYAMMSANSYFVKLASYFPFFTPFIMPFRLATDNVSVFELMLSLMITLVLMIASYWVSIIFYKVNVLTYSDKGILNSLKYSYKLWQSERTVKRNSKA